MKDNSGFGLVYAIAALAAVAVIVVAGALIISNNNKQSNNSNAPSGNTNTNSQASSNASKQQSERKYLIITEWKVKMPLSDVISDAYYVPNSPSQPDGMWLGLKSLDSKGCEAAQANSGGKYPIGALIKKGLSDTDPVTGVKYTEQEPNGTIIGQYYYAYHSGVQGSTTGCTTNANIPNINTIDDAFKEAAKNIVAE